MAERGNLSLVCASCGLVIEWLLGVPVQADGAHYTIGTHRSVYDHIQQSPHCLPLVGIRTYGIDPRFYPRFMKHVPSEHVAT